MTKKRIYGRGMILIRRKLSRKSLGRIFPHDMQEVLLISRHGRKWWHQFGHRWQHYLQVVAGMMFINGTNRTLYAASWSMVVSSSNCTHILECWPIIEHARDCLHIRQCSGLPAWGNLRTIWWLCRGFLRQVLASLPWNEIQECQSKEHM